MAPNTLHSFIAELPSQGAARAHGVWRNEAFSPWAARGTKVARTLWPVTSSLSSFISSPSTRHGALSFWALLMGLFIHQISYIFNKVSPYLKTFKPMLERCKTSTINFSRSHRWLIFYVFVFISSFFLLNKRIHIHTCSVYLHIYMYIYIFPELFENCCRHFVCLPLNLLHLFPRTRTISCIATILSCPRTVTVIA